MKHLLAAAGLGLMLSPAFAEIQVRSATLAYDTTLNVTWARDTFLFDTLAAQMGGAQALKDAIYQVSPYVYELPNATHFSDGRDPVTGSWYQLLDYTEVNGVRNYTNFSVDAAGNTLMDWYAQNAFVNYLNARAHEGATGWRLPRMMAGGNQCFANMVFGGACPDTRNNNEVQSLMYSLGMANQASPVWASQPNSPLYFRGLRNTRHYAMSDQMRRFTFTEDGEVTFINPPDWYLAAATSNDVPYDPITGGYVRANGIVRAKTDYAYFITLHDGDVGSGGLPPAVPEPATWMLLLGGVGLVAWRTAARRADRVDGTAH